MGSGDLNTKKSWHVVNLKNQRRVWESEQAALAERKKVNERVEELRKERQEEEITRQLEAAGGTKRVDRVDWMYQGPSTDNGGMVTEEAEAFLLGKRRIDSLLKGDDHKQLEKNAVPDRFAHLDAPSAIGAAAGTLPTIASARDMAAKIREDPLLAIKRQEQQSYEAMVNDPIRRRQLMAAMGVADDGGSSDKKKSSHSSSSRHRSSHHRSSHHRSSHRSHRDDEDEDDSERRHKRRRRDDSRDRDRDRDRDSRRSMRYSPDDDRRSSRRDHDDKDRARDSRRRDDGGRDRSRERRRDRSPRERRDRSPRSASRSRSSSPPRRPREEKNTRGERDDRNGSSRRDGGDKNGRSDRGDRNGGRDSRSYRDDRDDRNGRDRRDNRDSRDNRDNGRPPYRNGNNNGPRNGANGNGTNGANNSAEERARKLAAMQANAADLAKERESRLAEIEAKEAAARAADEKARAEDAKLTAGTGAGAMTSSFSTNLRKRVGDMGLAESLGRSRQGLQRDED